MSTTELKSELKLLIDSEPNASILEAIHYLLKSASANDILKVKLSSRALKSEADIMEGRVMDRSEFEKRVKQGL